MIHYLIWGHPLNFATHEDIEKPLHPTVTRLVLLINVPCIIQEINKEKGEINSLIYLP